MKNKVTIIIFLATFCLINNIFAQLQAGIFTGVKYGNLSQQDKIDFFDSNFAILSGLNIRYNTKTNFYFTGNLFFEKQGWAIFNLGEGISNRDDYVKGSAIAASLDVGYYFLDTDKIKLGVSGGYKFGHVSNNTTTFQDFKNLPDNVHIDFVFPVKSYESIDLKGDILIKLSNQFTLNIIPNYSINNRRFNNDFLYAERNFGLQTGILYNLSKQRQQEI